MMVKYGVSSLVDEIDIEILNILSENAKTSCKNLSNAIKLSIPRTYERIKKLEEKGIISGYNAKINQKKWGYKVHAFVLIKADKHVVISFRTLKMIDYIHNIWLISGEYNYMAEIYAREIEHLNDIVKNLYEQIGRTCTFFVMDD